MNIQTISLGFDYEPPSIAIIALVFDRMMESCVVEGSRCISKRDGGKEFRPEDGGLQQVHESIEC
jgi:hypothetical protein